MEHTTEGEANKLKIKAVGLAYVAVFHGKPIAVAHELEELEVMIDGFTGADRGLSHRIKFEPYDGKFPDDLEGTYFYRDKGEEEMDEYRVYCVDYSPFS